MAERDLILRVAELSRAAPAQWSAFLDEFKRYADRMRDDCVQAPLEQLQVNQGRAQNAAAMLKLFNTAPAMANALDKRAPHTR